MDTGCAAIIIIPMIVTLIGFYNFLYFITIGYGLSLSFIGLSLIIIYYNILNTVILTLCILLIIYGIRLSSYLIIREFCLKSYKETVQKDINRINSYPMFLNFIIINNAKEYLSSYISIGIIILGFSLEIIADHQKTVAKRKNPKRFVDNGLYRIVRCPNYFREILMWAGFFLSAIHIYKNWTQFLIALSGFLTLIFIMFGGARRLEMRQDKNYGDLKEYKKYKETVPIIIPFIPLYSVSKYSWLVG